MKNSQPPVKNSQVPATVREKIVQAIESHDARITIPTIVHITGASNSYVRAVLYDLDIVLLPPMERVTLKQARRIMERNLGPIGCLALFKPWRPGAGKEKREVRELCPE